MKDEKKERTLEEIREDPKTVFEIVKEILDAFKPNDRFLISIIKKLALELEDRKTLEEICSSCNAFIEGYKDIKLNAKEIEAAKKRFGL